MVTCVSVPLSVAQPGFKCHTFGQLDSPMLFQVFYCISLELPGVSDAIFPLTVITLYHPVFPTDTRRSNFLWHQMSQSHCLW